MDPLPRDQPLHPHPHQPDPRPLEAERVVGTGGGAVDLDGHVGGLGEGARAGDGGEVGEPQGEGDGAAGDPGHPHPSTDPGREPQQLAHHDLAVVGVAAEGLLCPHRPVRLAPEERRRVAGHHRPPVGPPRQLVEVAAEVVADRALEGAGRGVGDVADGDQAQPVEHRAGLLPHAVELADVERVEELRDPLGRHHHDPVGLGQLAAELGDRRRGRDPHRAGDPLLVVDDRPQLLGDLERGAEPSGRTADVEERLVEREHLDQRRHPAEGLDHRARDRGEDVEVGRDHHRLRAEPAGAGHRHRRADAVLAGEVVGRQHHPTAAAPDHDRDVGEIGPVTGRDGGVERVHVDVEDRAVPGRVAHRDLHGRGRGQPVAA